MSRYKPSPDEQAAIDTLTLAGYHVMRRRSYDPAAGAARASEEGR